MATPATAQPAARCARAPRETSRQSLHQVLTADRYRFATIVTLLLWSSISVAGNHTYPLRVAGISIEAEIASTPAESSRGLMFRRQLPAEQGMLFIFPKPRTLSFWMRNTAIPLDVGYFDNNGMLREIHPLTPFDERPVRSRYDQLRFALEVNQGWFQRHGVEPGAYLDLADVDAALGRHRDR